MKLAEITEKSNKELDVLVADQRQALASHVIEMRTKKVTNVKQTSAIKRIIAQALTIKRQRELSQLEEANNKQTVGENNG
jgi:ribosomal protein L29